MDYLVIGAGPAGLQVGYFLERAGRDYLILEAGDAPGAFFRTFPRHRRLISINKPHTGSDDPQINLRMDWNSLLSDNPSLRFTRYTPRSPFVPTPGRETSVPDWKRREDVRDLLPGRDRARLAIERPDD